MLKVKTVHVRTKGGSGSGFHGHAGIQGHQGGSAPQTTSGLSIATYSWLKNHPAFVATYIKPTDKQEVAHVGLLTLAKGGGLPIGHFDKLESVGTLPTGSTVGLYDSELHKISIAEDWVEGAALGDTEATALGVRTFIHEMGHHVSDTVIPWIGNAASTVMQNIATLRFKFEPREGLALSDVKRISDDKKRLGKLEEFGLRNYSLKNSYELAADTYYAWKRGSVLQKDRLFGLWKRMNMLNIYPSNYWNIINSLDDMFTQPWR